MSRVYSPDFRLIGSPLHIEVATAAEAVKMIFKYLTDERGVFEGRSDAHSYFGMVARVQTLFDAWTDGIVVDACSDTYFYVVPADVTTESPEMFSVSE